MATADIPAPGRTRRNRPRAGRFCVIEGCTRAVHAKDWCHSHYKINATRSRSCSKPNCSKSYHAQGFCSDHYEVEMRAGRIRVVRPINRPIEERFASYQAEPNAAGCRVWQGNVSKSDGRGRFTALLGRAEQAHRVAYRLANGELPTQDGKPLPLDHMCRTGLCTEAGHLQPVTQKENVRRGMVAHGTRGITQHDAWFWVALNAWRHGADNFPKAVVTKRSRSRVTVLHVIDGRAVAA